ncbi:MAG: band 7 protein [Clostridia bacterium]|jgi:flotillin|nr:band 7 protein [Clostridia bacterium]
MGFLTETLTIVLTIIGVIFLLVLAVLTMWRKVSQDKALVITGLKKRVISGGGGFVVPLLEKTDQISLENMKIEVRTDGALTEQGVDITADGVAVIKVKSDKESILASVEQFNTGREKETIVVIKDTAKDVLEGKLREIISKMSVEEIYKDREKFASQVQEVAALDLAEMGLEIKAFTIRDISDKNGYLEALGKKRIAEVKRDAFIAEAEANKETKIKTAEANRLGQAAFIISETQIAESTKDKELKIQFYRKEQETEKAKADLAYEIEASKVQQEVEKEKMQVQIVRKQKEIELAEQEAARKEKELEATVVKMADAEKYSIEKQADADRYKEIQIATAEAEAIKLRGNAMAEAKRAEGMAEVEIIRQKGMAEAEAMMKKAEAFKQYNDAAVSQMIIEKLPELAKAIAEPLSKTEKIVIVDSGSGEGKGAAKVSGYVTDILSTLPETVNALTGVNLMDIFNKSMKPAEAAKEVVKEAVKTVEVK